MPDQVDEEWEADERQIFWDNAAILLGVALIAASTPLQALEMLGLWPPNPTDIDIFLPPVLAVLALGVLMVILGLWGLPRARARRAKLRQLG